MLKVADTLVDDLATWIAVPVETFGIDVERFGEELCVAVDLYELEVQVGTEPIGLAHRGGNAGLGFEVLGILQEQVGVVDTLVEGGEVAVLVGNGIGALAIGVDAAGAKQIAAEVGVNTIGDAVLVVGAAAQVACPTVELVGEELEVVGLVPHEVVAQRILRVQVKAAGETTDCAKYADIFQYILFHYLLYHYN